MAIFVCGGGGGGAGGGIQNPLFKGGKENRHHDDKFDALCSFLKGYEQCERDYEAGYKEGYEKAKSECDKKMFRIYIKYHGTSKLPNWIIPGRFKKEDAIETVKLLNKSTGAPEYTYEYEEI